MSRRDLMRGRGADTKILLNRRLVRERDRSRSRELLRVLAYGAAIALPLLGYVWQRVDFLRVSYRVEALEKRQQQLREDGEALKVERSHLLAHDRIERLARKNLGLIDPMPDDVRRVRLSGGRVSVGRPAEAGLLTLPDPQDVLR